MTCVSPPEDLWCVASPSSQLRGTEFGSEEMQEMWKKWVVFSRQECMEYSLSESFVR